MGRKKQRIRIVRENKKDVSVHRSPAVYFLALFCTGFVTCAWVKAWLSFLVPDQSQIRLYAVIVFAAVCIWLGVYITQKGRAAALVLMAVPCIAAAVGRIFPDTLSVWIQMTAGMIYFMSGIWASGGNHPETERSDRTGKKKRITGGPAAVVQWMTFAVLLISAAAVSYFGGRSLDSVRNMEGGVYLSVRSGIQVSVIDRVEELLSVPVQEKETQELPENTMDIAGQEEAAEMEAAETVPAEENDSTENVPSISSDAMENLDSIASFVPLTVGEEAVILEQPPDGVYYLKKNTGLVYTGDSWEKAEADWQEPEEELSDEEFRILTSYPGGLARMMELCRQWEGDSRSMLDTQIRACLNEMAVYDTDPGRTPAGKDFAEYFLFENKKGFCVHFATAAALLWRMSGYPAVYVQGYAIPEASFKKQEDGRYKAVIDGSMGHAWCRVYNSDTGAWTDMEYTPGSGNIQPASDVEENSMAAGELSEAVSRFAGLFLFCICLAVVLFLQALIRSRHMARTLRKNNKTAFIRMYQNLLRTADFLPEQKQVKKDRHLSVRTVPEIPDNLKLCCPDIREDTWKWMRECIMELLFYHMEKPEIYPNMKALYRRILPSAEAHMPFTRKILYQFVFCLDPLFPHDSKRRKKSRRKRRN